MKQKPHLNLILIIILILAFISILFAFFIKNTITPANQKLVKTLTRQNEGFYSPIWSQDGTQIYFIKRDTIATITGGSLVPFTGEKEAANISKETFQIVAQNIDTKKEQILISVDSPRNKKTIPAHDINNIKGEIKISDDGQELNYILNIGFGAKDYISNYLSGKGQIDILSPKNSDVETFVETTNIQMSENPFVARKNLELVVPNGDTSIVIYNYDNQNITLFRKDKYGEFNRSHSDPINFNDIKNLLRKKSIISNKNQVINNVISFVLSKDFGTSQKQSNLGMIADTLHCAYNQNIEYFYDILNRNRGIAGDTRWQGDELGENRILVKYTFNDRKDKNTAEWIVENGEITPNNDLAKEISYYQYSQQKQQECINKTTGDWSKTTK